MDYINDESYRFVLELSSILENASEELGILFAAVNPFPEENGTAIFFEVIVGFLRGVAPETGREVVRFLLQEHLRDSTKTFNLKIFSGVAGNGRRKGG